MTKRNKGNQPEDTNAPKPEDAPAQLPASAEVVLGVDEAAGPDATGVVVVDGATGEVVAVGEPSMQEYVEKPADAIEVVKDVVAKEEQLAELKQATEGIKAAMSEEKIEEFAKGVGETVGKMLEVLKPAPISAEAPAPKKEKAKAAEPVESNEEVIKRLSSEASSKLAAFSASGQHDYLTDYHLIMEEVKRLQRG